MVPESLKIDDVASYLADTGWQRDPREWRGASVWAHSGEYELLVPARDGLRDANRRLREILGCLSEVENRPMDDIALDIARPHLDKQFFRTFPRGRDSGYISLPTGLQVLRGVREILTTAARTALEGPHFSFTGRLPVGVGDVLHAAELGPTRAGSYVIELRLATQVQARGAGGEAGGGRAVVLQTVEAVTAAQGAVLSDRPAAFDDAVTAGVSADLCDGLSELAGDRRGESFEISFRWARSQPVRSARDVIEFPSGSGLLLRFAAQRLRGLDASGAATVTGVIEGLHNGSVGGDRWRVKVRGELHTQRAEPSRRVVWIRLPDQSTYDQAILAHQQGRVITVTGDLSSSTGRVELVPERPIEF